MEGARDEEKIATIDDKIGHMDEYNREADNKKVISRRQSDSKSEPKVQIVEVVHVEDDFDEEELFAGMKKLSEFSSVLSNAMGGLAKSVRRMEVRFKGTTESMEAIKYDVDTHGKSLKYLKDMNDAQRKELAGAVESANRVEQNMSFQVLAVSGHVDNQIASQNERVGDVKKSLTECIQNVQQISRMQSAKSKTSSMMPKLSIEEVHDSNTEDVLRDVLGRLADLEATSQNQAEVNNILSMALTNTVEELTKEQAEKNRELKAKFSDMEVKIADIKGIEQGMKSLVGAQKRQDSRLDAMQLAFSQLKDKVAAIPLTRPRTRSPKRRPDSNRYAHPNVGVGAPEPRLASAAPRSGRIASAVPSEEPQPLAVEETELGQGDVALDTSPLKAPEVVPDFPNNVDVHAINSVEDPSGDGAGDAPADLVSRLGEESNCTEDTVVMLLQRVEDLEQHTADLEGQLGNSSTLAKDALFNIRALTNTVHDLENQLDMMAMKDNSHSHAMDDIPHSNSQRHHPLRTRSMAALAGDPNAHLGTMIDKVRRQWMQIYEDISFGVDLQVQQHAATPHAPGPDTNVFHHKVVEYKNLLQTSLSAIENIVTSHTPTAGNAKTNNRDCLVGIHPFIDTLVQEGENLLASDQEAKFAAASHKQYVSSSTINQLQHTTTFDDYLCSDRSASIAVHLQESCKLSLPLLDELIDKTHLRRRIHILEKELIDKAPKKDVNLLEKDLRLRINTKLDSQDYATSLSKKASLGELQQFRESIFKQMDELKNQNKESGRIGPAGNLVGGMRSMRGLTSGGGAGGEGEHHDDTIAAIEAERDALLHRFDLLFRQFQDLAAQCETYVPREEVEKALHAVLLQVKTLKMNTVDHGALQTKLDDKADVDDMKRLISSLEQSVGEICGNSASAIHLRCLMCDKPVSSVKSMNLPLSNADANASAITRAGSPIQTQQLTLTNGGRAMSPETNPRKERYDKERVKMTSDISVLKTVIGELPQIKEPGGADYEGVRPNTSGALRDKSSRPSSQSTKYRQRIRASAGGGGMASSQSAAMLNAASNQPQVAQMGFVSR